MFFSSTYTISVLHYTYGGQPLVQPILVISTYRITELHHTYKCLTLTNIGKYVC